MNSASVITQWLADVWVSKDTTSLPAEFSTQNATIQPWLVMPQQHWHSIRTTAPALQLHLYGQALSTVSERMAWNTSSERLAWLNSNFE